MAKKYLLYIHDERFDLESKKSELVNALLTAHYTNAAIVQVNDILNKAPTPTENRYGVDENGEVFGPVSLSDIVKPNPEPKAQKVIEKAVTASIADQNMFQRETKYCKNGHAMDERGRCFGKGCKYA